jgi:hypothetical protein
MPGFCRKLGIMLFGGAAIFLGGISPIVGVLNGPLSPSSFLASIFRLLGWWSTELVVGFAWKFCGSNKNANSGLILFLLN